MKRIALLIDAENVSHDALQLILDKSYSLGKLVIKRAYGNWTNPSLHKWRQKILDANFKSIQNFNTSAAKNASDISLVVDAMDLLYSNKVDTFIIVTSDSDFSGLVARISEEGNSTYVFGYSKSPKALRNACDAFYCIDSMQNALSNTMVVSSLHDAWKIYDKNYKDWLDISEGSRHLKEQYQNFSLGEFGFKKFSLFIQSLKQFEVMYKRGKEQGDKIFYYRPRNKNKAA